MRNKILLFFIFSIIGWVLFMTLTNPINYADETFYRDIAFKMVDQQAMFTPEQISKVGTHPFFNPAIQTLMYLFVGTNNTAMAKLPFALIWIAGLGLFYVNLKRYLE